MHGSSDSTGYDSDEYGSGGSTGYGSEEYCSGGSIVPLQASAPEVRATQYGSAWNGFDKYDYTAYLDAPTLEGRAKLLQVFPVVRDDLVRYVVEAVRAQEPERVRFVCRDYPDLQAAVLFNREPRTNYRFVLSSTADRRDKYSTVARFVERATRQVLEPCVPTQRSWYDDRTLFYDAKDGPAKMQRGLSLVREVITRAHEAGGQLFSVQLQATLQVLVVTMSTGPEPYYMMLVSPVVGDSAVSAAEQILADAACAVA